MDSILRYQISKWFLFILQRAWRQHKAQQSIRKITEMAMEAKLNRSLSRMSFSTNRRDSTRSNTSDISAGSGKDPPSQVSTVQQKQKKHLNNTLKVPTVGSIRLPSESGDINVWYFS